MQLPLPLFRSLSLTYHCLQAPASDASTSTNSPPHPPFYTNYPSNTHTLSLPHSPTLFPTPWKSHVPPPPANPYIFYTHGDSIPLTIAESTADNFHHLAGHHPRDIKHFARLVPNFPRTQITSTDTFVFPLLSIQVTLFPNAGICVAVTNRHVIDGRIRSLFMKSWASVFKARGRDDDSSCLRPFYDRDVIKDPNGVMPVFLAEYFRVRSTWEKDTGNADVFHGDNVKATYVLNGANIEFLKDKYNFSSFVITCAFIWVCRMKTEFHEGDATKPVDDDELCYLAFPADCRNRLKFPVPSTYFGNCLASCKAAAKRSELVGEEGFVVAAKAIAREISRMKSRPLEGAEKWMEDRKSLIRAGNGRVLIVGGSPSFNDYGRDFGWGKPKRFELINHPIFISVADCRDGEGALEVGVVLRSRAAMDTFSSIFEQSLKLLN